MMAKVLLALSLLIGLLNSHVAFAADDEFDPIETLREWGARLSPHAEGNDERLREIGLSGRMWKVRDWGSTDCPTNVRNAINVLEANEPNFDIRHAYAVYMPGHEGWNYHTVLYYKGYILDLHMYRTEWGVHYLQPMTPTEYFATSDARYGNYDPYSIFSKLVMMRADRFRREMFMRGDIPYIMRRIGHLSTASYVRRRIPRGMYLMTITNFIQASTEVSPDTTIRECRVIFDRLAAGNNN